MKRSEVLAHRIHAQQLDRAAAARPIIDADVFDFGVQDTGREGASWALANRGVPVSSAVENLPDLFITRDLRSFHHSLFLLHISPASFGRDGFANLMN